MQKLFTVSKELITGMVNALLVSYDHNWIPLTLAILTAAIMSAYVNQEKLKQTLIKRTYVSIWAAVLVGAFTPLCACGTMAVILGMLTTALPWGPVMAFLTSSPLMSPDVFIMTTGIINLQFSIALTVASIMIGLGSGYLTLLIEKKTNFLKNQTRFSKKMKAQACGCSAVSEPEKTETNIDSAETIVPAEIPACGCAAAPAPVEAAACACSSAPAYYDANPVLALDCCSGSMNNTGQTLLDSVCCQLPEMKIKSGKVMNILKKIKWREIGRGITNIGLKQILIFYSVFVMVGFLINYFVPTDLIIALFSSRKIYAVPLAALIGFPIYLTGESAMPLIKSLMAGGAGLGSMLAFVITGAGTSGWVVAGIAVFMKKKVVSLYILCILLGGIISGYLFDLFLMIFNK